MFVFYFQNTTPKFRQFIREKKVLRWHSRSKSTKNNKLNRVPYSIFTCASNFTKSIEKNSRDFAFISDRIYFVHLLYCFSLFCVFLIGFCLVFEAFLSVFNHCLIFINQINIILIIHACIFE